jgi:hypothetical protein
MIKSIYELLVTLVFISLVAILIFGGLSGKFDPYRAHLLLLSQDLARSVELGSTTSSYVFLSFTPTIPVEIQLSENSVRAGSVVVSPLLVDSRPFFAQSTPISLTDVSSEKQATPLNLVFQPARLLTGDSSITSLPSDCSYPIRLFTPSENVDLTEFDYSADSQSTQSPTLIVYTKNTYVPYYLESSNPALICLLVRTFTEHAIPFVYSLIPGEPDSPSTLYFGSTGYDFTVKNILKQLHINTQKKESSSSPGDVS